VNSTIFKDLDSSQIEKVVRVWNVDELKLGGIHLSGGR